MALLTISGLHKSYPGKPVLQGVELSIQPGCIVGLLGPNASGKTTLLKVISGLLSPDAGSISYPAGAAWGQSGKAQIAFLPDYTAYPGWMKVKDAFRYYSEVYPDYSAQRAKNMIELLELPMNANIMKLSKGMQERVSLGLVFSREAALYLLDEPLGGIDPVGKAKVLESILSAQNPSSSILLSTHLVKDVEAVIDSILLLSGGKVVYQGDCETIRLQEGKTVEQVYMEVFLHAGTI